MQRWDRLGSDRPPDWLRPLKWLGVAAAMVAGYAYSVWYEGADRRDRALATAMPPAAAALATTALAPPGETPVLSPAVPPLATGGRPPSFELPLLGNTQTVSLAQFEGQPVLINFWASWCLPCREETPALERAYRDYAPQGLVVLGINSNEQDTEAAATAFVREFGVTYPQLWDATDHVPQSYGVIGLPMSVFVNADGEIEHLQYGVLTAAQLDEYLSALLP